MDLAAARTALQDAEDSHNELEQQLELAQDALHNLARVSSSMEQDVLAILGNDAEPK